MLSAIKIISILLAAAAGIMGSVINFKSSSGKLTFWGKACITLVIISSFVTGGIQAFEDDQSEKDTLNLMRANAETLARIDRSLLQFDKIGVYALIAPDWSEPEFRDLMLDIKLLQNETNSAALANSAGVDQRVKHALAKGIDGFGSGQYGADRKLSDLFFNTLCTSGVKINVFKGKRIEIISDISVGPNSELMGSDLVINVRNPCFYDLDLVQSKEKKRLIHSAFALMFSAKNGEYVHLSHPIDTEVASDDQNAWRGNGSVLSVPDILGSTLIFELDYTGQSMAGEGTALRKFVGISYMRLNFVNGISLGFSKDNLKLVDLPNGNKGYLFYSGDTVDSLIQIANVDAISFIRSD